MLRFTGSLAGSEPELPSDAVVVNARHDPPWATVAAVEEALLMGERLPRAAHRLRATLHELRVGAASPEDRWRDRWRRAAPGRAVVIRRAEDLDPETAQLLLDARSGLGHPVHVSFGHLPADGPARKLADRLELRLPTPSESLSLPADPAVRVVLRAAAAVSSEGQRFRAAEVAMRLERSEVRVLEALQQAAEQGFPLADHGDGVLSMPAAARLVLLEGLLPSLLGALTVPSAAPARAPTAPIESPPPLAPTPEPSDAAGAAEARVRAARSDVDVEASSDPTEHGIALLELAHALRSRFGLGVRLQEAIDTAREAVVALAEGDVHTRAAARSTLAHLLVEHGLPASLDEALDEVVAASRELADAGDAVAAASLLNDQAEVWLKLGDPVRATHLLHGAEDGLQGRDDPNAVVERAETAHLLARLPLYAQARPGLTHEALERALEHLVLARDTYQRLGWGDRLAHALDTEGRLLGRLGRTEPAVASLQRAAEAYRQLGDGLGLARATEGLAMVWAAAGQVRRATALLEQSLVLNAAARTPAGLAFVRRAAEGLPEGADAERLFARLQEAERVLGRMELPPSPT